VSDILPGLYGDHSHLATIAAIARQELAALESGDDADFGLLEDVMRYVTGYPDTHHHPTEDVVYAQLRERVPGVAADVDQIVGEHADLLAAGRKFLEAVQAVEEGAVMRREEFLRRAREYFDLLESHMRDEESRFFPLAAKHLTEVDWAAIEHRIERQSDPVFEAPLREDYRRLRQRIDAGQQQAPR
jgi:hemerythrin-like domain-containing protein